MYYQSYPKNQTSSYEAALENLVDLKAGTISKYEQDYRTLGINQLVKIAKPLECTLNDLLVDDVLSCYGG